MSTKKLRPVPHESLDAEGTLIHAKARLAFLELALMSIGDFDVTGDVCCGASLCVGDVRALLDTLQEGADGQ